MTDIDGLDDLERTAWFHASDLPWQVGPYEVVTYTGYLGWAWWTGERWGDCWPRFQGCLAAKGDLYKGRPFQWVQKWRGLTAAAVARHGNAESAQG